MKKWEKDGKKRKKPNKPKLIETSNQFSIHSVPKWVICRVDQVCYKITDGSHNPPKKQEKGFPMLSARNVENDNIVLNDYRLIDESAFEMEYNRANVEANDVLLTVVGTIGRSSVVPSNLPKFTLQRSVALLKTEINSKFLSFLFQSPNFQIQLLNEAKGTAQKGVYLTTLKGLQLPLCSKEEQKEIVDLLEYRFSIVEIMESTIKKELQKSELNRQSILKKAFKGNLVSQDSKDEPASALLVKIKEEKENYLKDQKKQKKTRKKASMKNETLKEIIEKNFKKKDFTFEELNTVVSLSYEELKEQLFELIEDEKGLSLTFSDKEEKIKYKLIG